MPAVSFEQVTKVYPDVRGGAHGGLRALDGVSFDIEAGEFFGLLGPNGAGKTTLISVLAGLARATSGRVRVNGFDVAADYAAARRQLGIVPQELVFDPFFSVRESLVIQSGYFGVRNNGAWIDELLHHLGLADKADANMRQLSGGMKRRVLVAQALVHKPAVIVLDEPTAGVDVELRQTVEGRHQRIRWTARPFPHAVEQAGDGRGEALVQARRPLASHYGARSGKRSGQLNASINFGAPGQVL